MKRLLVGLAALFSALTLIPAPGLAQSTITGQVVDAGAGQPLGGVQVFIPQLNLGALSQASGQFQIANVPAGTHTVQAQRLGYTSSSQEVTVTQGGVVRVDFVLSVSALSLDAMVITGTAGGTQRRAIGNVVTTVDAASLQEVSAGVTMQDMIGARTPGVMVMPTTGAIGSDGASIRIRGSSSPSLSNEPIVYVDGIRINSDRPNRSTAEAGSRLNDINPADIESIEIIKGPAAATLYGTEASNGVIQIITKRGVTGDAAFDASVEYGVNYMPDPAEKAGLNWGRNPQTGALLSHNLVEEWEERFNEPLFQYGPNLITSISARGGTDVIRYFGSFNTSSREGVSSWNKDESMSGRLNLGLTVGESLNIDLSSGFNSGDLREDGAIWGDLIWGNPAKSDLAGGLPDPRIGYQAQTPISEEFFNFITTSIDRRIASVTLTHTPREWFSHRAIGGFDIAHQKDEQFSPRDEEFRWYAEGLGQKSFEFQETRLVTFDYSGTATTRLMDERLGTATSVGLQYYGRQYNTYGGSAMDFATAALSTVSAASDPGIPSEAVIENNTVGVYFQEQLDWDQRMFLTAAVRLDDNSAFGTDFKGAVYPKLSGTWVVSEEDFWNIDVLDEFRLRGAWGQAGKQPDVFAASRLYEAQAGPGGVPIATPSAFGNPDLAPEVGEELELGFDAALYDGRIGLAFTGYWRTTKDAIVSKPTAESLGFPSNQLINIGETKSWGTEASLDVAVLTQDPLRWDMSLSVATMANEIGSLGGETFIPVRRGRAHVEGFPLAGIFAQKVLSADLSADGLRATNIMCDGGTGPGNFRMGGDPVSCTGAPLVYWGRGEPTWQLSLANTVNLFTSLRLYAQIDASGGNYNFHDAIAAKHTTFTNTVCANVGGDPICKGTRAINRAPLGFFEGGFAKLRELSVTYTVPGDLSERFGMSRASINWAWRNVGILWFPGKYAGEILGMEDRVRVPDPEMGSPSENFGGEVVTGLPPLSSTSVTVRVSF